MEQDVFGKLMAVILDRKANRPPHSYTTRLFDGGVPAIGDKIMEEAAEVVEAASAEPVDRSHVVHEAADLLYHLFVLLGYGDVSLDEVRRELERRFGTSGLDEKAAREES